MRNTKVKKMVIVAMLGSIGYLLMMLNFPFPGFPPFLKIDFSDIPALIAALIFGPAAGILVEFIKNVLDYATSGSITGVPVGQLANFAAGILYILPTYYIYSKIKSKKGMTAGLIAGTVSMAVLMSVLNYFVFLPAYTIFLGQEAMNGPQMRLYITSAILPFNIVKGVLMTAVFLLLFSKLQPWIQKQSAFKNA